MSSMTAEQAVQAVLNAKPDAEVRVTRRMEVGSVDRQGDIYIHRVADDHPRGKRLGTRKVAVGDGEGSNHLAEGEGVEVYEGVQMPEWVKAPAHVEDKSAWTKEMLGPVVVVKDAVQHTHTTHAHHHLPGGTYQVTYQADEATGRRVRD